MSIPRPVALHPLRALCAALLLAGAADARAEAQARQLVIWGGGKDPSDAVRALEDLDLALAEARRSGRAVRPGQGFPMVLESARIAGLKPGFVVVALGLCASGEVGGVVGALRTNLGEAGVYSRAVDWTPESSSDVDLCPRTEPARDEATAPAPSPSKDCGGGDGTLCLVRGGGREVHLEWASPEGVVRSGPLPPPLSVRPEGVVGLRDFELQRLFELRPHPTFRTLTLEEKAAFGGGMTEGGEDALVTSRQLQIERDGRRIVARSLYAYSLAGDTSCNENVDFASGAYDVRCQRSCRTVQKRGGGEGEAAFECVPVGEIKAKGKVIVAAGKPETAPRPIDLTLVEGRAPRASPRATVRWQPGRLSFELQTTDPDVQFGPNPAHTHVELWLAREMILLWEPRLIESPTDGVRHLVVAFDAGRAQVRVVQPGGKPASKPIPGSVTRNLMGHRIQFDLDHAELVGTPRGLKGTRERAQRFHANETLLFTVALVEGDGHARKRVTASSPLRPGVPATFGRLFLAESERLPEVGAALFGLSP